VNGGWPRLLTLAPDHLEVGALFLRLRSGQASRTLRGAGAMPDAAPVLIPPKSHRPNSIVPAPAKNARTEHPQKKVGILRLRNAIQKTNRVPALRKTIWRCRVKVIKSARIGLLEANESQRMASNRVIGPQRLRPRSLGDAYGTAEKAAGEVVHGGENDHKD